MQTTTHYILRNHLRGCLHDSIGKPRFNVIGMSATKGFGNTMSIDFQSKINLSGRN